ncbi:hypothetical protein AOLI_G00309250 [Acnodon oligacanthus]
MERLVLDQLRPIVQPFLDPLQFAYQPRLGVEDAIIYLLNCVYAHLDKPASTVRVMFFDFSSTFNTVWSALLGDELTVMRDWAKNIDALYRKGQSRLYFLRRLRSFNICWTMLRIFYVVASAILYAVACWGSRLRVADANRLNKLILKAGDVVGVELDSLMAVLERKTLSKLQTIMENGSHPLYDTVMRHRSTFSARLILPK